MSNDDSAEKHDEGPADDARPTDGVRLTGAEADVLADELAGLVRSGLPLPGGLHALANELGRGRTADVLRQLAGHLEAGQSLDQALASVGNRLSGHLRGLITAGVASGRLSEVLEAYVDLRRDQAELRRRMWLAVAYPLVLVGLLVGLFLLFATFVVPMFRNIFEDFGASLPAMTELVLAVSGPGVLYVVVPIVAVVGVLLWAILGPVPYWVRLCVYEIPIFGPFWRWGRLLPAARLLALLVEHGTSLPEALRLMAAGLGDRQLAARCVAAADQVASGRSLGASLTAAGVFPHATMPLLDWGARFGSVPAALRFVAESFESRTRLQVEMAQIMTLPSALLVVLMAGFMIIALFLPLISLVECLSK